MSFDNRRLNETSLASFKECVYKLSLNESRYIVKDLDWFTGLKGWVKIPKVKQGRNMFTAGWIAFSTIDGTKDRINSQVDAHENREDFTVLKQTLRTRTTDTAPNCCLVSVDFIPCAIIVFGLRDNIYISNTWHDYKKLLLCFHCTSLKFKWNVYA